MHTHHARAGRSAAIGRVTGAAAALLLGLGLLITAATPRVAAASDTPLVVIDPGHGGRYSNANANGLREKNVNLAIALELRNQLASRGYRVLMTRTTDRAVTYADISTWNLKSGSVWAYGRDWRSGLYGGIPKDDLQARVNLANRNGADLFISIHNNGSTSRWTRGTESFASPRDPAGITLSRQVHARIVARTGLRNRGARTADFYVCRWANMPAILVEGAFITNPSDAWKLRQASFRKRIALGITEAVDAWFTAGGVSTNVAEIGGADAAQAAVALSQSLYPTGAPTAVVARADRWDEAMSAPALARRLGGPLLWTGADGVGVATSTELARLSVSRIVAVGSESSYSTADLTALAHASRLATGAVESVTAAEAQTFAARATSDLQPTDSQHVVFADAGDPEAMLEAAAVAATLRAPLLQVSAGAVTPEASAFLSGLPPAEKTAVLIGNPINVPVGLASQMASARSFYSSDISTLAGTLNRAFYTSAQRGSMTAIVADYGDPAAYLTAAWYAAVTGRPLAPATPDALPVGTRLWITNRRAQLAGFTVFDTGDTMSPLMGYMLQKADKE